MPESLIVPARVRTKSAYEPVMVDDGLRILIDRVWPAGVDMEKAKLDDWMKDLAPSTELLMWIGRDLARWDEFRVRYIAQLRGQTELLDRLRALAVTTTVTLLYGSGDATHNQAVVVREVLLEPSTV